MLLFACYQCVVLVVCRLFAFFHSCVAASDIFSVSSAFALHRQHVGGWLVLLLLLLLLLMLLMLIVVVVVVVVVVIVVVDDRGIVSWIAGQR